MEKCNIVYCPSFCSSKYNCCSLTDNIECCEVLNLMLQDNKFDMKVEIKKCDNHFCNAMIIKGMGKKYNSMNYSDKDIKIIELCDRCSKDLEA